MKEEIFYKGEIFMMRDIRLGWNKNGDPRVCLGIKMLSPRLSVLG